MIILIVVGAIITITIGGLIGLRRQLLFTIVGIGCFAAVAIVGAFGSFLVSALDDITSPENALVLTLLVLTLVPLLLIYHFGRKALVKLHVTESISPLVDATLGSGYLLTIYLVIITVTLGGC